MIMACTSDRLRLELVLLMCPLEIFRAIMVFVSAAKNMLLQRCCVVALRRFSSPRENDATRPKSLCGACI